MFTAYKDPSRGGFKVDHQGLELEKVLETRDETQTSFSFQELWARGLWSTFQRPHMGAQGAGQPWDAFLTESTASQSALARGATATHHGKTAADPCSSDTCPVPPIRSPGHNEPGLKVYKGKGEGSKIANHFSFLRQFPCITRYSTWKSTGLDMTGIVPCMAYLLVRKNISKVTKSAWDAIQG